MTKQTKTKVDPNDQFGMRWISDPFDRAVMYPVLPRIPYSTKNKKEAKDKVQIQRQWEQTFHYPDFSSTPSLLLGFTINSSFLDFSRYFPSRDDPAKTGIKWRRINHQCGGAGCNHHLMVATRLTPTEDFYKHLCFVTKNNDVPDTSLNGLWKYDRCLKDKVFRGKRELFRLGCQHSYRELDEALYPIDVPDLPINLKSLVKNNVPTTEKGWEKLIERCMDPVDSFTKVNAFAEFWRAPHNLKLYAVTENSD